MNRPLHGAVLAFDFGEKRIGVAVGEIELGIPHALTVITAEDNHSRFAAIAALIAEWRPVLLVVGVAAHADGAVHETGRLARRFGQRLTGRFGIATAFVDERLTSSAAESALRASGVRAGKRAALLDAAAAAEILRTWFTTMPQNPA
ncbi:MAG: Holliday junction resolvase RuvX [Betaproteobacteria bacterium]|nr:MAG: Holliday junction resolvase RuvX [Betaproteobacteria bacterium]